MAPLSPRCSRRRGASRGRTRLSADAPRAIYLDASAVVKLVVAEYESEALGKFVAAGGKKVSSEILLAESIHAVKRRAAARGDDGASELGELEAVVEGLELRSLTRDLLMRSGQLAPSELGTLDAIHLATALSLLSVFPCFVSYDRRQLDAARRAGLATASPGAESG